MASRVNVKFVIVLSAALVLAAGGLVAAYLTVLTTTAAEHAARGDELAAAGEWVEAAESYSKAVNEERTSVEYLEKWIGAMEMLTPASNAVYVNRFTQQYLPAVQQLARIQRTNVEAQHRYLRLRRATLGGPSRGMVAVLGEDVRQAIAPFERDAAADPMWNTLRRYRGIALAQLAARVGDLTREEIELAEQDLRAVLAVDPGDGEAAASLVGLLARRVEAAERLRRGAESARLRDEITALVDGVLAADPDDPWALAQRIGLDLQAVIDGTEDPRAAIEAAAGELHPALDRLATVIASMPSEAVNGTLLEQFSRVDRLVDPRSRLDRLVGILRARLEREPGSAELLYQLGRTLEQRGELPEAASVMARIEALERLPLSLEGTLRINAQRLAARDRAEFELRRVLTSGERLSDSERASILANARAARDAFAERVAGEEPELRLLDGMLAEAEGRLDEASRLYASFNATAPSPSALGAWLEGRAALQLGRLGLAGPRLEEAIELRPTNVSALLLLATVRQRENRFADMVALLERAAELVPDSAEVAQQLENARVLAGAGSSEDPVRQAVLESRRLASGTSGSRPDPVGAERVLRSAIEALDSPPALVLELARVLLGSERFEAAREVVEASPVRADDPPGLVELRRVLAAGSLRDAVLTAIEASGGSELEKAKQRAAALRGIGDEAGASAALAEAAAIDPDDPEVLDGLFLEAVRAEDFEAARAIADRAAAADADGVGGRAYRARLLAAQGDAMTAANALQDAVEISPVNPVLWRLLGEQLAVLGRFDEAADALGRSVEISPTDAQAVANYLRVLVSAGRPDEALEAARRLRSVSGRSAEFVELYVELESRFGGPEGRAVAIDFRASTAESQPRNLDNKRRLASLYIQDGSLDLARSLIDDLKASGGEDLSTVELEAAWHAAQGAEGLEAARRAYTNYIVRVGTEAAGVETFLSLARFMNERGRYGVALAALDDAAELEPGPPMRPTRLRGEVLMRLGRQDEAADVFRRIVDAGADTEEERYRLLLIDALMSSGEIDAAEAELDALGAGAASGLGARIQRIAVAERRGDLTRAATLADRLVADFRGEPQAWAVRAQVLGQMPGRIPDAMDDLSQAMELAPQDWSVRRVRSGLLYQQGEVDRALDDLVAALEINPNQTELLVTVVGQLIGRDRTSEARAVALRALDAQPNNDALLSVLRRSFAERGEAEVARELAARAWETSGALEDGFVYLEALLAGARPQVEAARALIGAIERAHPGAAGDWRTLVLSAVIEGADGRSAAARRDLERALQASAEPGARLGWMGSLGRALGGSDGDTSATVSFLRGLLSGGSLNETDRAWVELALAETLTGDEATLEQGLGSLRALASEAPDAAVRAAASRREAVALSRAGRPEAAIEAWSAALEGSPDDWQLANNIAAVRISSLGDAEGALPMAERAASLAPNVFETQDTLAAAQLELGRLDEAEATLARTSRLARTSLQRLQTQVKRLRVAAARGQCGSAVPLQLQIETELQGLEGVPDDLRGRFEAAKAEVDSAC